MEITEEILKRELQPLKDSSSSMEYELMLVNEKLNGILKLIETKKSATETVTTVSKTSIKRVARAKQCRRTLIIDDEPLARTTNKNTGLTSPTRSHDWDTERSVGTDRSGIVRRGNTTPRNSKRDISEHEEHKSQKNKTLTQWYLVKRQNSVVLFGKNMGTETFWRTTPVVERLTSRHLRTQSNAVTILEGPMDEKASRVDGGCSAGLCAAFKDGFPLNWKSFFEDYSDVRKPPPEKNMRGDQAITPSVAHPTPPSQRILPNRAAATASPNRAAATASSNRAAATASSNRAAATTSPNRAATTTSSNRSAATTSNRAVLTASPTASPSRPTVVTSNCVNDRTSRRRQQPPAPIALGVSSSSRRNLLKENEISKMVASSGITSDEGAVEVDKSQKKGNGKHRSDSESTDSDRDERDKSNDYSTDSEININNKHRQRTSKRNLRAIKAKNSDFDTDSEDDYQPKQTTTNKTRSGKRHNNGRNNARSKTKPSLAKKENAKKEAEQKLARTINWVASRSPIYLRNQVSVNYTRYLKRSAPTEDPQKPKIGVRQSKRLKTANKPVPANQYDKVIVALSPLKGLNRKRGRPTKPKSVPKHANVHKKDSECLADAATSKTNRKTSVQESPQNKKEVPEMLPPKKVPEGLKKEVPKMLPPKKVPQGLKKEVPEMLPPKKVPQGSNKENKDKDLKTRQPPKVTAKQGTLKRRKQIRECREYLDQDYEEDDIFAMGGITVPNQMRYNFLNGSDSDISTIRTPTTRSRRDSDSDSPRSLTPCTRLAYELTEMVTRPETPEGYRQEDEITDSINIVDVDKVITKKLKEKKQIEKLPPAKKPSSPKVLLVEKPPPKLVSQMFPKNERPESDLYDSSDSYEYFIANSDSD